VYLTCTGVRLLYALQHKLPPFYHNLGARFNKTEFVRVCRLSGVHQIATCFEVAIDEIWRLLDSAAAGLVAWEHARQVLKLGKWQISMYPPPPHMTCMYPPPQMAGAQARGNGEEV
jgi:hypothetical protein